jgi:tRNA-2-methylthio-N6-dimethylallyladenosine synthase
MNFLLHTYGCQMNERDSEAVASLLIEHGHVPAASEEEADLVIVNTCTVRGKAEDKAIGKLGLLTASARARPGLVVGVIGCAVQRMGASILEKVRGLDFALGPHRLWRLPEILDLVSNGRSGLLDAGGPDAGDQLTGHLSSGPSAFVTVLLGCDRHCAYCIVPSVRGPERSRPGADVVAEISALAASGVREITLLGQSVMSYGLRDPVWPEDRLSTSGYIEPLPRLLHAAAAVPGVRRLRFTSGHPSGCTPELARAMSDLPAVCEHLHLPVQSGSDRILRAMNRGYDSAGYRAAVDRLRERVPGIALTTDVIVGFPSETAADFEATRSLLEEIGFDNAFIFKYSPRAGTPAAGMNDDVPAAEKARRNRILLEDQDVRGLKINSSRIGRVLEVMAEGPSRRNPRKWAGRTRSNVIVVFDPPDGMRVGDMMDIRIERAMPQTLYGKVAGGDR